MYDISAIGEVLIDFAPIANATNNHPSFCANPGGAPANVLAQSAKLGGNTAFLGKVGADDFGTFLKDNLLASGIDCQGLIATNEAPTTLAFVHLDETGDRSFSFYRKNCADTLMTKTELNMDVINTSKIFHFGSVSLTDEPTRSTTLMAATLAKHNGSIISYDPNYRPLLWSSEEAAVNQMTAALDLADILKVSEEEAELMTGTTDCDQAATSFHNKGISLVLITKGGNGSYFSNAKSSGHVDAFTVDCIDTTGSGDAFFGALLHQLRNMTLDDIANLSEPQLRDIVRFANAAGGITATGSGAIPPMPNEAEILAMLGE